jgi:cytochrome c biogenesis protein CcdA/thiol-disulfide isomerase/thioredoxin
MLILILFSLLSGLVTVLSPCVLPVLPIVLSSSAASGKRRPLGVISGLIISFSLFTLAISQIVQWLGLSAQSLRIAAVAIIGILGLSMIIPKFNEWIEKALSFIPRMAGDSHKEGNGFWPGFLTGLSLGLVWAPCAGPILASVTALAATQDISLASVLVVIAYAIGSGIPLLAIAYGGRSVIQKVPFLSKNLGKVQQVFGIIMILTAVLIAVNVDVLVTVWLTDRLPSRWTSSLSAFENSDVVNQQLGNLGSQENASYFTNNTTTQGETLPNLGPAPELVGLGNWFNSDPLTMAELRGKVVLVDFWTYSCVNCVRTLPYIRDWHAKYADDGLVIIGVHTPEFAFEEEADNVQQALNRFDIQYAVAQDNDYQTWRAFNNRYWPAKYLIDAQGNVRYTHFGEGDYEETELAIQELLAESGIDARETLTSDTGPSTALGQTPETYVGYGRQSNFSSPESIVRDTASTYTLPDELDLHHFAVAGEWTFSSEYAQIETSGAQLELHFYGKDAYLVMDSANPAQVNVQVETADLSNMSEDVDENGNLIVDEARLYHLASFNQAVEATITLTFKEAGVQAFAFTFGS